MYDTKALIERRKFLMQLKNRAKFKHLKKVLHEDPVFTKEDSDANYENAETLILSEDLDTTNFLQKVATKLRDFKNNVDFCEDNCIELVYPTFCEKDKDPKNNLLNSKSIEDANNISVNSKISKQQQTQENTSQSKEIQEQIFSFLKCQEILLPSDDEIDNFLSTHGNVRSCSPDNSHFDPFADSDNNSKDSDYVPSRSEYYDDYDSDKYQKAGKKIVILENKLIQPANKNKISQIKPENNDEMVQHCEYSQCSEEIFSSCSKCLCFLCWNHFDNESTYNDCLNHTAYLKQLCITEANTNNPTTQNNSEKNQVDTTETKKIIKKQNQTDDEDKKQHCEYIGCEKYICSTCNICSCFLCVDHYMSLSSDNNCDQHKPYIKETNINKGKKEKSSEMNRKDTRKIKAQTKIRYQTSEKYRKQQHCEHIGCEKDICSTCLTCSCFLCTDHFMCLGLNNDCDQHKPYITETVLEGSVLTKGGTIRKRKLYCEDLAKRKEKKALLQEEKFSMKEPCLISSCKKQCMFKFNNNMREDIYSTYHNLSWEAQGLFIKALVDVKPVARRNQNTTIKRDFTYYYNFFDKDQNKIEVCKTFFLSTLGYNPKNDKRVFLALKKSANNQKNLKGSYERKNKIDREVIKQHVMKYQPSISHYRRQHAPNRLYLPSDLNITIMFKHFCDNHPEMKISLETYRKIVTCDLNISFTKLGHEECEVCAYFQLHNKDHVQNRITDCEVCCNYGKHKEKYTCSRAEYQKDVQNSKTSGTDTIFYSVDLQKVVMLPRMEQYKTAIFCPRIVVFNETFVPLGSTFPDLPYAVIWPESIAGRNAEDLISAFHAFLLHKRDKKHIVLWMDNCSSQNKNWAIFSFLVEFVNSDLIAAETITFKYLEPGHTFMSADSFHHQVELSLKRQKKVYDLSDFTESVRQANSGKSFVKEMKVCDFYDCPDSSSQAKLRKRKPRCYMADIASVKAERGFFYLRFKTNHKDCDESAETLDFLVNKIMKTHKFPERAAKTFARGVARVRKDQILKKLVPLMPQNRRQFWYELPESEIDEAPYSMFLLIVS